jgi:hypothetical protein
MNFGPAMVTVPAVIRPDSSALRDWPMGTLYFAATRPRPATPAPRASSRHSTARKGGIQRMGSVTNLCDLQLALPERANRSLLMSTMEADPILPIRDNNQNDATGFIRLNALRLASGIVAKVQSKM